jgi:hypothetical protein
MPVGPSMGVLTQLGMNSSTSSSTPSAASTAYEWLHADLSTDFEVIRNEGLRGTRLHPIERQRQGRRTPGGTIKMQPTYAELGTILTRTIGAASGAVYSLSDTVPVAFQVIGDYVAKVITYIGCRTDKVVFHGGPGQPMEMDWSIEALDESVGNAGTFGSLTISGTPPYVFEDAVLTIASSTYQVHDFEISVDWHLKKDRWVNSLTRTDLPSMDLTVGVKFTLPWTSDTVALRTGGVSGVTGDLTLTYLGTSTDFNFGGLIFPPKKTPVLAGRDELTLVLSGQAYSVAAATPMSITLDSTP